jgi:hypothetical protein
LVECGAFLRLSLKTRRDEDNKYPALELLQRNKGILKDDLPPTKSSITRSDTADSAVFTRQRLRTNVSSLHKALLFIGALTGIQKF